MNILNIEIKIKVNNSKEIEAALLEKNAQYIGEDHQIDTYFKIPRGRLKLREGNIENSLILYQREETKNLKKSVVKLQKLGKENTGLKDILTNLFGVFKVVDKRRKIFFIDNVKFHIDTVKGLGKYVEIEAISSDKKYNETELTAQCDAYIDYLKLDRNAFIDKSYSDLVVDSL